MGGAGGVEHSRDGGVVPLDTESVEVVGVGTAGRKQAANKIVSQTVDFVLLTIKIDQNTEIV